MTCKNPVIAFEAYQGYCYSENGGATLASHASDETPNPNWTGLPVGSCDTAECVSVTEKSGNPISFQPGQLRSLRNVIHNLTAFHLDGSSPQPGHIGFKSEFIKDPRNRELAAKKLETYCKDPQTLPNECEESCEALSLIQCHAVLETLHVGQESLWNSLPAKILLGTVGTAVGSYFVGYGFSLGGAHAVQYSPTALGKTLWRHSAKKLIDFFSKKDPPEDPPTSSGGHSEVQNELRSQREAPTSPTTPVEFAPAPTQGLSSFCGGAGIFYTPYVVPLPSREAQPLPSYSEIGSADIHRDVVITATGVGVAGVAATETGLWTAIGGVLLKAATGLAEAGLAAEAAVLSLIPDNVLRGSLNEGSEILEI